MSDQNMDWKDISFKFCPPSVYCKLEAKLLVGVLNGAKLLADTLGAPRGIIDTAGRRNQSSSADILKYLMEDGQTTWRKFYDAVVSHHREDIRTVLDRPDRQKAILDYYKNSWEYARKTKTPKTPTEDDDPMEHLGASGGKDHDETAETARSYLPSPSPRTQPNDISVEAKTVNIFVLGPTDSNSNSLSYPSPTSPNGGCPHHRPFRQTPTQTVNSGSLSGGTLEISTPNQNFKRSISNDRENQCKCKKIAAGVDDMETDDHTGQNVASGVLPNICTFLPHGHDDVDRSHQVRNGLDRKLRVKAEQGAPKREFVPHQMAAYRPGNPPRQENRVMNGHYERNAIPVQKNAMQWQTSSGYPVQSGRGDMTRSLSGPEPCQCCGETRVPSLGSSVPPNRSQSVVEPLVSGVNKGPMMPKVGSEPGGTWPKSGLRSTATSNASESVSEPRNMQYSEFRRGRLLFLFNAYSQKKACAMGRYFYDQFKIGVKLGYWSLQNDVVDEIGQEIKQDVANSTWIAICLDRQYLQIIQDFENSREKYRPLPRNKNFNIRYTYALLKSENQRLGPSARQILLFYTPDVDLRVAPAWLLNASSKTQYKLPVASDLLLTEKDQNNLYWIFRQVGLLSDHIGQRNDQARLYKRNLCQ